MKLLIALITLFFANGAFAQAAPPRAAKMPSTHVKSQAPLGCKLVGTVRGAKIWAGDCVAATPVDTPAPSSPPAPSAEGDAPAEKQ
ncbi:MULTISPECIES: hypothetical protein [Bradyrhizobium]|uniref:Uncharacterized protein n=1 Tax=Bradyrhizobium frederickii TaxID=2560054 RepID=A0A4Y9KS17_9BRAD|nr:MULTISPECIES: hypothetical protein [Bradyrhizobium]TFV29547.1 hypothetical protein E4K66_37310 [Bradyrhizobium frederickii]TFV68074.1 hypothetical protein E4K64_37430 [Bradyrhizobium frederickii]